MLAGITANKNLLEELADPHVGVVAPRILNPAGNVEDSARQFPKPGFLVRKLFGFAGGPDYTVTPSVISPASAFLQPHNRSHR